MSVRTVSHLAVVIPVFNEAGCIEEVLASWRLALDAMHIDYEIMVCDDGSSDGTPELLDRMAATWPRLRVAREAHTGHGPTIHRAYARASADWILQIDGDGEVGPEDFRRFWAMREQFDLVIGRRTGRRAVASRRIVSALASFSVRLLFGRGVSDPNCPYRLWKAERLQRLLPGVHQQSFAPNVLLSALALYRSLSIHEVPISAHPRRAGKSSLFRLKLWSAAFRAIFDLVMIAVSVRRGREAAGNA